MRYARLLLPILFITGCSADLAHESPFDEKSPLEKQAKAQLTGRILLENETDFSQISLQLLNDQRTYSVQTLSTGAVELSGIVPGTYTMTIGTRYFSEVTETIIVPLDGEINLGERTLSAKRSAVVGKAVSEDKAKNKIGNVDVKIEWVSSVRTAGASGAAFVGAAEDAAGSKGPTYNVVSESDGTYRIADVPAGVYELTASDEGVGSLTVNKIVVTGEDGDVTVKELILLPMFGFIEVAGKNAANAVSTPTVTVNLDWSGSPSFVQLAFDPDFLVPLPTFSLSKTARVDLPAGDGEKSIFVRYFDELGNPSSVGGDTVVLDTKPPKDATFTIAQGSLTKTPTINLSYFAVEAETVRFGEGVECSGTREAYTGAKAWPLQITQNATTTIRVQFFDAVGNASECLSKDVTWDDIGPNAVSMYAPAATSSNVITVTFGPLSGASRLKISEDPGFTDTDWVPFVSSKTFVLSPGNGTKTIHAVLSDDAGNTTTLTPITVTLDTTPPVNPYLQVLNPVTTSSTAVLSLGAGLVTEMMISENPNFTAAAWETYVASKSFGLNAGDGVKTIYAKFRKASLVETDVVSATITVDTTPPILPSVRINNGALVVADEIVTLNLSAVDATSGLFAYKVNTTNSFAAVQPKSFQSTDVFTLGSGDGSKTVWVVFADRAGNYSAPAPVTVVLDTTPPSIGGAVELKRLDGTVINSGSVLRDGRVILSSPVSDLTTLEMQVTTNGSFGTLGWEPFNPSKVLDLTAASSTIAARVRDAVGHEVDLLTGFIVDLDAVAPVLSVSLGSATPTKNLTVSVSLGSEASTSAQVSGDPVFAGAVWFPLQNTTVTLSAGDGVRTIYARARDLAGNISDVKTLSVTVDQTPPSNGGFVITSGNQNGGVHYTKIRDLNLTFSGVEIDQVSVAEGTCSTTFGATGSAGSFTVSSGDGIKTVAVLFADALGNYDASNCVTKTITLDETEPEFGFFAIDGNATYATSRNVRIGISITGATELQVSENAVFNGASWAPVTDAVNFTLSPGEGSRTLYARFRDEANNVISGFSDSIIVDTVAPSFHSLSALAVTNGVNLVLTLTASVADEMRLSENSDFSGAAWVAFSPIPVFPIANVQGQHTVYVQLRDNAGNESIIRSHTTTLDSAAPNAPVVSIAGGAFTKNNVITVQTIADGAVEMQISQSPTMAGASWVPYGQLKSFSLVGGETLYTVYVIVRDAAGNPSGQASATVTLDQTAPQVLMWAEDGQGVRISQTNATRYYMKLTVTDATPVLAQFNSLNSFSGATSEAVAALRAWDVVAPLNPLGTDYDTYVRVVDAAGNATVVGPVKVLVDTLGPTSPTLSLSPNPTSDTTVDVTLSANNASFIELSEDIGFLFKTVIPNTAATTHDFGVGAADGTKTMYARFVDAMGNYSPIVAASVALDRTPPEFAAFSIAQASPTNDDTLDISLSAVGAAEVSISIDTCNSDWQAYSSTKVYSLPGVVADLDRDYAVRVRYRDALGNTTACLPAQTVHFDNEAPELLTDAILIDNGSAAATVATVTVSFDVNGATQVKVSENSAFSDVVWTPYSATRTFNLSTNNGNKRIYAIFRDDAGNETVRVDAVILLDTSPVSTPFITISKAVTSSTTVRVNISASDVAEMMLSENEDFSGAIWESYATFKDFAFTATEGEKTLFAKFRKVNLVESVRVSDTFILDQTPPILPTVRVNNGVSVVSSSIVTLNLSAVDVTSAVEVYQINSSDSFPATQRGYQPNDLYTLSALDGMKTIFVKYGDRARNYSATASVNVTLDTTPPSVVSAALEKLDGTVLSTGNTVRDGRVILRTNVSDTTALEMQVSTTGVYGMGWEPYNANKVIDLTAATSNIIAQVRDAAGHIMPLVASTTILLDSAAPVLTMTLTSSSPTKNLIVSVDLSSEALSAAQISGDPGFGGAVWFPIGNTTVTLTPGDGVRTIYARVRDVAGNVSDVKTVTVVVDQTAPGNGAFVITSGTQNGSVLYSNSRTLDLTFSGVDIDQVSVAEGSCSITFGATASAGTFMTSAGDGVKTIAVLFADALGNYKLADCITKTVTLDETDPEFGFLALNGGAAFTTSRNVTVGISVTGATEMQLSENAGFTGAGWMPVTDAANFTLSGGEGSKTVYARFRDLALNVLTNADIKDSISVDTVAPGFNSASAVSVTRTTSVTLSLTASNADQMRLSENADFTAAAWVPYSAAPVFTMGNVEGAHTIYVQLADNAGNESIVRSVAVEFDETEPDVVSVALAEGSLTNLDTITVLSTVSEAAAMIMSEAADFSAASWKPYLAARTFALAPAVDGLRTVYVKYRDVAGNETAVSPLSITVDKTLPVASSFSINADSDYTQISVVQLGITASDLNGVTDLMISENSSFVGGAWEPFTTATGWILSSSNEQKNLYLQVRDAAGNISLPRSASITLDTQAPYNPLLSINLGAAHTNDRELDLSLSAVGADQMIVGLTTDFAGSSWVAYSNSATINAAADGSRIVFARFRDAAGNQSDIVSDSIAVDTVMPQFSSMTVSQSPVTRTTSISLSLSVAGADELQLSESPVFAGATWTPFSVNPPFTLEAGADGTRVVYARFRDLALNTTGAFSASILLDTAAPTAATVSVNGGAEFATQQLTVLDLSAVGAAEMIVSESPVFAGAAWETYAEQKAFLLSSGEGLKTVHVKFRDAVGNATGIITDTIDYDPSAPQSPSITIVTANDGYANEVTASLVISAANADWMMLSESPSFSGASWEVYSAAVTFELTNVQGNHTIYAKFKDDAGNESATVSDTVYLDTIRPVIQRIEPEDQKGFWSTKTINLLMIVTGADTMKLGPTSDLSAIESQPYSSLAAYELTGADGTNEIHMQFEDLAGNVSEPYNLQVVLDRVAPASPSVSIDSGAPFARNRLVQVGVTLDGTEHEYIVSENIIFGGAVWQPLPAGGLTSLTVGFTFQSVGEGTKTVYFKTRDRAGNESTRELDTIDLDTVAPVLNYFGKNGVSKDYANSALNVPFQIDSSNADYYRLSTDGTFDTETWSAVTGNQMAATANVSSTEGVKRVYAQLKDEAGNESAPTETSFILDTTAPQAGTLSFAQGSSTNTRDVFVLLSATGADFFQYDTTTATLSAQPKILIQPGRPFTLPDSDGLHTYWVRYGDKAENYSDPVSVSITLDRSPPTAGNYSLLINDGDTYTTESVVTLAFVVTGATEMQIRNQPFFDDNWEPVTTSTVWFLPQGDGLKGVFVRFRDDAGNIVGPVFDAINLDQTAPEVSRIVLDNNAAYTNSLTVSLRSEARDVTEMRYGADASLTTGSGWIPFVETRNVVGTAGDETKTVYAQFRDAAGNTSAIFSDSIILDQTAPSASSLSINSGATFTREAGGQVVLSLSAVDELSGVSQMQLSNTASFAAAVTQSYITPKGWTLDAIGEGSKEVWARFKDRAGNYSTPVSDFIVLDRVAPAGLTVSINTDSTYATSNIVSLTLTATDANGVADLKLSTLSSLGDGFWQPFTASTGFILPAADMAHRIYAKVRDEAGNESSVEYDEIILDTAAPEFDNLSAVVLSSSRTVPLQVFGQGATQMRFSTDSTFAGASWVAFANSTTYFVSAGDGAKIIYGQLRDAAGLRSDVRSVTVELDTAAPLTPVVRIREGDFINDADVEIEVSSENSTHMLVSQYSLMTDATWQPYNQVIPFTFTGGDGVHSIYVRVRDGAGNVSNKGGDMTTLDTVDPTFGVPSILINAGAAATNSSFVFLGFDVTAATELQVSEDAGFGGASWVPYSSIRPFTLSNGDGSKTVYARFRDQAGNDTATVSASILLDTKAPSSPFISAAYAVTKDTTIQLTLSAVDANQMKISQLPDFSDVSWIPYGTTSSHLLTGGDGSKLVYAKFRRSTSGMETPSVSVNVLLDRVGPADAIAELASLVTEVTSTNVTLRLSAADAVSGLDKVEISESPIFFDRDLISMRSIATYTLRFPTEDFHPLYVRYLDRAGNYSSTVTLGVIYDVTPPTGTIEVAGGAERINSQFVTVALTTNDAEQIKIYNDSGSPTELTYSDSVIWAIRAIQDTPTTVNVVFIDTAGNESTNYSDIITYDTQPPSVNSFALGMTVSTAQLTLAWSTSPIAFGNAITGYTWYRHLNGVSTVGATVAAAVTSVTVLNPLVGEEYSVASWYADGLQSAHSSPAVERGYTERTKGVLLVDDDAGATAVEDNLEAVLTLAGFTFDTLIVPAGTDGPSYEYLADYQVVVWSSGQGPTSPTLSAYDRDAIKSYLESGGNLLYLGSDAMSDTDTATFLKRWMHTGRIENDIQSTEHLYVTAGDIGGASGFDFAVGPAMEGIDAAYTSALSDSFLNAGKPIGLRYPLPGASASYRAAMMAMPTQGIYERSVFSFNLEATDIPSPSDPGVTILSQSGSPMGDDSAVSIALPFPFRFGGIVATNVWVGSNGVLGFVDPVTSTPYPMFPTTATAQYPGSVIASGWNDLQPQNGGKIFYTADADSVVIVWDAVPITAPTLNYAAFATSAVRLFPDGRFDMVQHDTTPAQDDWMFRFDTNYVDVGFEDENGSSWFETRNTFQECCHNDDFAVSVYFYNGVIPESVTLFDRLTRWLASPPSVRKITPRYFTVDSDVDGATEMQVTINGVVTTLPYQDTLPITGFPAGDGSKTVQVVYADVAGNTTTIFTDTEVLDTDAPRISNVILTDSASGSNASTRNRTVTLQVLSDASSLDFMRASESPTFVNGGWVPYVESATFTLSEGDGDKLVYVWLKDANGNIGARATGTINADTISPTTFAFGSQTASQAPIYISTSYLESTAAGSFAALPAGTATGGKDLEFMIRDIPFAFSFFGKTVSKIVIWPQGFVTFQVPNPGDDAEPFPTDRRTSRSSVFSYYKIAAPMYLSDLAYTKTGQDIYESSTATSYTIRWVGEDPRTQTEVNVALRINSAGEVSFYYGDGNLGLDPFVGIGNGEGNDLYSQNHLSSLLTNASTVTFTPNEHVDARVKLYYRYHYPAGAGAWIDSGLEAASVFDALAFYPPNGAGEYDFYTVGIDTAGNTEAAPATADLELLFDDEEPVPPTGLSVEAEDDSVFVQWQPSLSSDVVGYRIYYGSDADLDGEDATEGISPFDIVASDHVRLSNLEPGKIQYVAVSALDQVGNESPIPSGVGFTLPRVFRTVQTLSTEAIRDIEVRANVYFQRVPGSGGYSKYIFTPLRNPYGALPATPVELTSEGSAMLLHNMYLFTSAKRYDVDELLTTSMNMSMASLYSGELLDAVSPGLIVWSGSSGGVTLTTSDINTLMPVDSLSGGVPIGAQAIITENNRGLFLAGTCCMGDVLMYGYTFVPQPVDIVEHGLQTTLKYPVETYDMASGLAALGSSASLNNGMDRVGVQVYNAGDPNNVTYVSAVTNITPRLARWAGDRLVTSNNKKLQFYDYGDVTQPVLESSYSLSAEPRDFVMNGAVGVVAGDGGSELIEFGEILPTPALWTQESFDGSGLQAVETSGDYVYIADGSALTIYKLSGVTHTYSATDQFSMGDPEFVGSYAPFQAKSMVINGNYLYAIYEQSFSVVDISNPANPLMIWMDTESEGWSRSLTIIGTTLFTASRAFDIRDPRTPKELYEYSNLDLDVLRGEGEFLYGSNRNDGIGVYQPSKSGLQTVGYYGPITSVRDIVLENGALYAYQSRNRMWNDPYWDQLTILDVSSPAAPTTAAEFPLPYPVSQGNYEGTDHLMVAQRGFLYMTEYSNNGTYQVTALVQIDLRDIKEPLLAFRYETANDEVLNPPLAISPNKYLIAGSGQGFTSFRMTPNVPVPESFLPNSMGASTVIAGDRYVYYASGNQLMQAERRAPALVMSLIGSGEVSYTKKGDTLQLFDPPGVPAASLTADGTGSFDLTTGAYDTAGELCTALASTGRLGCSIKVPANMPSVHLIDAFGVRVTTGKYPSLRAQKLKQTIVLGGGNAKIRELAFNKHRLFAAVVEEPETPANVEGLYVVDPINMASQRHDLIGPTQIHSVKVIDDYAFVGTNMGITLYNWATKSTITNHSVNGGGRITAMGYSRLFYIEDFFGTLQLRGVNIALGSSPGLTQIESSFGVAAALGFGPTETIKGLAVLKENWIAVLTADKVKFVQLETNFSVKASIDIVGTSLDEVNGRLFVSNGTELTILDALVLPPTNKIERKLHVQGANIKGIDVYGDMLAIAGDTAGGLIYRLK